MYILMYYLPERIFCVNSNILPRAGLWRVGEGGGSDHGVL
jgi:hypothetical protein